MLAASSMASSSRRPPHLITPEEVDGWLAGSAVRGVTYHRTSVSAAREIVARGVDITRSEIGAYGQGFYTATEPDPIYGSVQVVVAVRSLFPLRGDDTSVGEQVDRIAERLGAPAGRITAAASRGIRRELLRLGYDGIVVLDGGGDGIDYVIALEPQSVKLVRP